MPVRPSLLSRMGAVAAVGGLVAAASGCASGTTASPRSSTPSGQPRIQAVQSTSASPRLPPTSEAGRNSSVGPLNRYLPFHTYDSDDVDHMSPAKPGGSSVQVQAPCGSATVTLRAYPEGAGVGMTATLRPTSWATWDTLSYVTPYLDDEAEERDPTFVEHTTDDGALSFQTTNLDEPTAVTGFGHAWPQMAEVDLSGKEAKAQGKARVSPPNCFDTSVYLDADEAAADSGALTVHLARSGTLRFSDRNASVGGTWQVTVTIRSPAGAQRQTRSVSARPAEYDAPGYTLQQAQFRHLTGLRDFTSVSVTASKDGRHRTWMTLSRTP